MKSYLVFQLDKIEKKKIAGLLYSLRILKKSWESISMYFICGFLRFMVLNLFFVIIDRFSKYYMFILAPHACPAKEATRLVFNHVVNTLGCLKILLMIGMHSL